MDTSQLMRLATKAGFTSAQRSNVLIMESLKVFARAIELQVREECAKECEQDYIGHSTSAIGQIHPNWYFAELLRSKLPE